MKIKIYLMLLFSSQVAYADLDPTGPKTQCMIPYSAVISGVQGAFICPREFMPNELATRGYYEDVQNIRYIYDDVKYKEFITSRANYKASPEKVNEVAISYLTEKYTFSRDFKKPASKQGIGEFRHDMTPKEFDTRYEKFKGSGVAYRQYNLWWSALESSGMSSSNSPLNCPAGYKMFPANEDERKNLGFHKYRCINNETLARFDNLMIRDQNNGMQSGLVLWSSPAVYRNVGCTGFGFGGNELKDGCVPRDDAMDDFEDYTNLLASRYNGGQYGKVSHFIVWNENNSPDWFDLTPVISKHATDQASIDKRLDKYAAMLIRTHNSLIRHQKSALMYVSTDQLWSPWQHSGNFGTQMLLDGIWARLGIKYSWSVAVHPYGDVDQRATSGTYTFQNLEMVSNYQISKLKAEGISNPQEYPQTFLIASEQGWPLKTTAGVQGLLGKEHQARQLCLAHDKVMSMDNVVAVGHNYFQSIEPNEKDPNGSSGQGAFFGLIPYDIANNLDGIEHTATGRAYMSTVNPINWKKRTDHYCCELYSVGCPGNAPVNVPSVKDTHQITGHIDGITVENNEKVLSGWACMKGMSDSIMVHLYAGEKGIGAYKADMDSEKPVTDNCISNASKHRFKIKLDPEVSQKYSGQPIIVYGISTLELGNHALNNSRTFKIP